MSTIPERAELESAAMRARSYADQFSLPLRDQHWRGNPGDHAGLGVGSSVDFQDHRNYIAGDDPRHINWQAYARTGDYSLKLYREEVRPVIEIIFDVSGSMWGFEKKATRALELLYFCFASAERGGATAHVSVISGSLVKPLETQSLISHQWRDIAEAFPETESSEAPALARIPFRPRSMRVLISDLLFTASPEGIIRSLQHNNGRGIILCPFSRAESAPDWNGNYDFVDCESGAHHDRRVDAPLLKRYLQSYQDHFGRWKSAAIRAQAPMARISSTDTFETAIRHESISAGAIHLV